MRRIRGHLDDYDDKAVSVCAHLMMTLLRDIHVLCIVVMRARRACAPIWRRANNNYVPVRTDEAGNEKRGPCADTPSCAR